MNIDPTTTLGSLAGAVTAISGIWAFVRHIKYSAIAKKDRERQDILDKANEEMGKIESKLNDKIRRLEEEFKNHKENLEKDLGFMRSTYNAEIRTLGDKIEALRENLEAQHSQLVNLLTKLVSKN